MISDLMVWDVLRAYIYGICCFYFRSIGFGRGFWMLFGCLADWAGRFDLFPRRRIFEKRVSILICKTCSIRLRG